MKYIIPLFVLILTGCRTGNHGTFVPSTYIEDKEKVENVSLGTVKGHSEQIWFFYILPIGDSPSTKEALEDALLKNKEAKYLSNVSIDDRIDWYVGYRKLVIKVEGDARK